MKDVVHTSGKRKTAIARATVRSGKGTVRVNKKLIDTFQPKLARLKILEPLMLAEALSQKVDIDLNVNGGGVMSQAEAGSLAISRALVQFSKDEKLEKAFLKYDRRLLVADVRRKETHKPNSHGRARAKRQKSYR